MIGTHQALKQKASSRAVVALALALAVPAVLAGAGHVTDTPPAVADGAGTHVERAAALMHEATHDHATDHADEEFPRDASEDGLSAQHAGIHVYSPSTSNGNAVFISPTRQTSNVFTCPIADGSYPTEAEEAWHTEPTLRDLLLSYGFTVIVPDPSVTYTDRIQAAIDYDAEAYVTLHSNAHGSSVGCSHPAGGTQLLYHTNADKALSQRIFDYLAPVTPGTASNHEAMVYRDSGVYELTSTAAHNLVTGYVEVEFHDTGAGAQWIHDYHYTTAHMIAHGVTCHFGDPTNHLSDC